MTEEDTFRKLRRTPHEELFIAWMDKDNLSPPTATEIRTNTIDPKVISFFAKHGWTYLDYLDDRK